MKKFKNMIAIIVATAISFSYVANAQVAINTDGSSADASAMLDVKSVTSGILFPRINQTQRVAINNPANGLLVFQTDGTAGLYSYNGSEWIAVRTNTYSIGDFAQGGIVFWVDETGEHGLVCAKRDQDGGSGVRWYAGTTGITQAKGDGPFSGEANTKIIIAAQVAIGNDGNTYAARICNENEIYESPNSYYDWYLPSKEELNQMYLNKAAINTKATTNGGTAFASTWYWSSTELNYYSAYLQNFDDGEQGYAGKSAECRVRAIRAF